MYFMSDPQALHVTRNVIPGKLGVDLHLHRVHIPLVVIIIITTYYCFAQCVDTVVQVTGDRKDIWPVKNLDS